MKTLLSIIALAGILVTIGLLYESTLDPYEEGTHWDYMIVCEGGFIYKVLGHRRGTIQIFNSDGTPLRCGESRY